MAAKRKKAKGEYLVARVTVEMKRAMEQAAEDDDRALADYLRLVVRDHLRERGYLKSPAKSRKKG